MLGSKARSREARASLHRNSASSLEEEENKPAWHDAIKSVLTNVWVLGYISQNVPLFCFSKLKVQLRSPDICAIRTHVITTLIITRWSKEYQRPLVMLEYLTMFSVFCGWHTFTPHPQKLSLIYKICPHISRTHCLNGLPFCNWIGTRFVYLCKYTMEWFPR